MMIELTELGEGETQWSQTVEPEEIELAFPEYSFHEPVAVRLSITHLENQYILKGQVATRVHTRCVKCLEEFDLPISEQIGWAVQVMADLALVAKEEESEDFWYIDRGASRLEIAGRVRETILVSLLDNPVCRPDCRGLCPRCGANLNEGLCGCSEQDLDSRWGPLKDLLGRQSDQN